MSKLLDLAEGAAKGVTTDVTFKRPDRAYVEYIACSEILLNVIPKSKEFVAMGTDRNAWQKRYKQLRDVSDSQNAMMTQIVDMIKEDNVASGVIPHQELTVTNTEIPTTEDRTKAVRSPRPYSMPHSPTKNAHTDELFLDAADERSLSPHQIPLRRGSISKQSSPLRKEKPTVQPKPASLRLHPLHPSDVTQSTSTSDDQIADRFSRLRVQRGTDEIEQPANPERHSSEAVPSKSMPTSLTSSPAFSHHHQTGLSPPASPSKPLGPRPMPAAGNPVVPPKIPLSPATFSASENRSNTSRSMYDSVAATMHPGDQSRSSSQSRPSAGVPEERSARSWKRLSDHHALANGVVPPSRSSSMQPPQTAITAAELYEILRSANVLLIDVRNRSDFDVGHIQISNILCVEPIGIKSSMSSEELEDSLVYSPNSELELFDKINMFDYVVYYDQSTASEDFLAGPPTRTRANHLRAVHDTLFEFNDYRPLRRRPIFLQGGLDAWIDLMGLQALASSETVAGVVPAARTRRVTISRRSLGRLPSASANSSLEIRKRRLREQKPLDAEEERSWLEKAQKEEVDVPLNEKDQSDSEAEETSQQFAHSYDEFFRRFPEPGKVQQSMNSIPIPLRVPPPTVPPPPPPAVTVGVPSRPPPAVPRPSYGGVSDQKTSQLAPIQRQNSAAQQPLYTSRSLSRYRKLPRTGLVNFGVTCYMNATIQCLLATIPISQFFLGEDWRRLAQKNWKGSNGILPEYFANLIRSLWTDDSRPVRPTSLRSFCARLKDEWGIDRQQDAKEFFDFIVDCLHEDLNVNYNHSPLRTLTDQEERVRESWTMRRAANTEWGRYSHRESSYISDHFAGQHASRLKCTACNSTSTTYEPFYSISVEIPVRGPKRGNWHLNSCLRSYCQEERLSGDEVWKCPHCKTEREATKQIIITRAPRFLVLHFKRFEMRKGDAKKVHTAIDFPLHGLDFSEYMVRPDKASSEGFQDQATSPPFVYDCYAVMRHIGNTGNGGHYISLVKDSVRGCWRKFDDDRVTDFEPNKLKGDKVLQNEQAYLVFYERSNPR